MKDIVQTPRQPLGDGVISGVLSSIFRGAVGLRNVLYDSVRPLSHDLGRPVVSIGAIHAGGVGKTPMSLLVARHLVKHGHSVAFLSRGFGRPNKGMVICKPGESVSWEIAGDEPALLHAALPESWLGIHPNRRRSARRLCEEVPGDTVFVLDDGFQHRQVKRGFDVVCLPAAPFSDKLMPAGTLREPLASCGRADRFCIVGSSEEADECTRTRERLSSLFPRKKPAVILYQIPVEWRNLATGEAVTNLTLANPLLVSGIARPERFTKMLAAMGTQVGGCRFFDDHHVFEAKEIEGVGVAGFDGIVTTEKDAYRLNTIKLVNCQDIWYLKIGLSFADQPSQERFFADMNNSVQSYIPKRR
jgi:tetraacyldisaccharide 4'-kinase